MFIGSDDDVAQEEEPVRACCGGRGASGLAMADATHEGATAAASAVFPISGGIQQQRGPLLNTEAGAGARKRARVLYRCNNKNDDCDDDAAKEMSPEALQKAAPEDLGPRGCRSLCHVLVLCRDCHASRDVHVITHK